MNLDADVEAALQKHLAYYASGVCGIGNAEASMSFKAVFCKGWNEDVCDEIIGQLNDMVDSGIVFNTGLSRNIIGFTKFDAPKAVKSDTYNPGGISILWDDNAQFVAHSSVPDSHKAVSSGAFSVHSDACCIRFAGSGPVHGSTLKTDLGNCYVQLFRSEGFVPVLVMMMLYYIVSYRREDCIIIGHHGYPHDDDIVWQQGKLSLWDDGTKWAETTKADWKTRRAQRQHAQDCARALNAKQKKEDRQQSEAARQQYRSAVTQLLSHTSSSSSSSSSFASSSSSSSSSSNVNSFSSSVNSVSSSSCASSSSGVSSPLATAVSKYLSYKEVQELAQKWKVLYGVDEIMAWSMLSGEAVQVTQKKATASPDLTVTGTFQGNDRSVVP